MRLFTKCSGSYNLPLKKNYQKYINSGCPCASLSLACVRQSLNSTVELIHRMQDSLLY